MTSYYQIERALSSTGTFVNISPNTSDVYYIDNSLSAGFYWYRVRPVGSYIGSYSNIAWARTV